MKRLLPYMLLLAFALSACEKVIEFDTTMSQQELVLNAVPSAGKQLFVNFSYSFFFIDTTANQPVPNADMVVSVNGIDYRPIQHVDCNYFFDYTLQENDSLSIRIDCGDQQVTAHTHVPLMPDISNPQAFTNDSGAFHLMIVNFNINDHPGYKDYYYISLQERDSGCRYSPYFDRYDTIDTIHTALFFCNDQAMINPEALAEMSIGGFVPCSALLSSDKNIEGQTHNTTMMLMLLRDTNELAGYIHQYTLCVESVTYDRYRYLSQSSATASLMSMITEPPEVYSNVEGALGIFAGNAKQTFPLLTISYDPIRKSFKDMPLKRRR